MNEPRNEPVPHTGDMKYRAKIDNLIYQMITRVTYEANNIQDYGENPAESYRDLYDLKMSKLCDEMTDAMLDLIDLIASEKSREQIEKTLKVLRNKKK